MNLKASLLFTSAAAAFVAASAASAAVVSFDNLTGTWGNVAPTTLGGVQYTNNGSAAPEI